MNIKTKWLLLALLAIGALSCYTLGLNNGAVTFIALGLGLEVAFWLGLFKGLRLTKR